MNTMKYIISLCILCGYVTITELCVSAFPSQQHFGLVREVLEKIQEAYLDPPSTSILLSYAIKGIQRHVGSEGVDLDDLVVQWHEQQQLFSQSTPDDVIFQGFSDIGDKVFHETEFSVQDLNDAAIHGMLEGLDSNAYILSPEADWWPLSNNWVDAGILIEKNSQQDLRVVTTFDDSPAYHAGIRTGDILTGINDHPTQAMNLGEARRALYGKRATQKHLTILDPDNIHTRTIAIHLTDWKDQDSVVHALIVNKTVGYIRLSRFRQDSADEFNTVIRRLMPLQCDGLIIDLRNVGGGLLYEGLQIAGRFLEPNTLITYTQGRHPSQNMTLLATSSLALVTCPLIILVNQGTSNLAEMVTGALQAYSRALIVGENTAGKGIMQSILRFNRSDGMIELYLPTAQYVTPDHKHIHQHGITPNVHIAPQYATWFQEPIWTSKIVTDTRSSLLNKINQDMALRVAVSILKKGDVPNIQRVIDGTDELIMKYDVRDQIREIDVISDE